MVQRSGEYLVQPRGMDKPLSVFCDAETDNGGWLVSITYLLHECVSRKVQALGLIVTIDY